MKQTLLTLLTVALLCPAGNAADSGSRTILTLRSAIVRAVSRNLDVAVAGLTVPMARKSVVESEAAFDPVMGADAFFGDHRLLTGSVLYTDDYSRLKETGAGADIRKRFITGLEGMARLETRRSENNSMADALDPQYRNILLLNLTQPLLKDFGVSVNTTRIAIARKSVEQAVQGYLARARTVALDAELAYLELAKALSVLALRIESRELAAELMDGNRERFRQGMVSVTEVDQAGTAVAARDEAVIAARQQVDIAENVLKDLLEIRPGDSLYGAALGTETVGDGDTSWPTRDRALAAALEKRADLKRLRSAVDAQEIQLAYLDNQKLPRLDLGATLGLNGLAGDDRPVNLFGSPRYSGLGDTYGDSLESLSEGEGYEWAVDLRVTYPLGNRAADARYSRAALEKRQLNLRIDRLEGAIDTQVSNALAAVTRSHERVQVADRFQQLARHTLDQENARLRQGLSDTFRVLNFQDDVIAARIRKVTAVIDFHQGLARLYRAMGANLERHYVMAEVDPAKIGVTP